MNEIAKVEKSKVEYYSGMGVFGDERGVFVKLEGVVCVMILFSWFVLAEYSTFVLYWH